MKMRIITGILIGIMIINLTGCFESNSGTDAGAMAPTIILNGANYFAHNMPVDKLSENYSYAGELTKEEANGTGLEGSKYYWNIYLDSIPDVYVYQECGTPIDEKIMDPSQRQWAYMRWVDDRLKKIRGTVMNWKELMQSIVESYFEILKDGLVGIYLHGSCAFGCESKGSDIDFIVVVKNEPSQEQKEAMINSTLEIEQKAPKKGLEMSVVLERNCLDFVYPTPYCLHYSRMHRRSAFIDPASYCRNMNGVDHDLAAHFTVIKKVGIVLYGEKIDRVFSEIPWENYVDSICRDIEDAKQSIQENPVYFILNLCRVWAACRDRLVLSKEQGGIWARNKLSEGYLPLLDKLLRTYRMGDNVCLSDDEKMCLTPLAELMMCQIELDKNR